MKSIEEEIYYNIFIPTPRAKAIINDIIDCKKSFDSKMEPISMMVMGGSGLGKTALANHIALHYPASTDMTEWGEQDKKEVLVVNLASNSTKNDAASEILKSLGDPNPNQGKLSKLRDRIRRLLRQCGVKLIIIDEVSRKYSKSGT